MSEIENTSPCKIRIAKLDDLQDIYELEQECFKIPWSLNSIETDLTSNNNVATYLVAVLNEKIVGYIGMWQILDEAQVTNLCVSKEFRGRKIASLLIESLIVFAREHEAIQLTLEVRQSNSPARTVYERAGFVEICKRNNYYKDNGEDAIIMLKNIPALMN